MRKVMTIIGTRPQFVKAAVLSRIFKEAEDFEEIIIHTGQHFDKGMSEVFFKEMNIPEPKYNLNINGLGHGAMIGRMIEGLEKLINKEQPDIVLLYGDTNSTLAGALAASKAQIPVAHVEAGLRSFNMDMPEEINRILTDRISDWLFAPTQTAVDNLKKEGFDNYTSKVFLSGDIMQDAALYYAENIESKATKEILGLEDGFILCTCHRADNTDDKSRLSHIVEALNELHQKYKVVLPLHPRTLQKIKDHQLELKVNTILPVGYFDMIALLKKCALVVTDSGGLQKEAFFFQKGCVTMRDQTEWTELISNGFNLLTGAEKSKILVGVDKMLAKRHNFKVNLYGNGKAGENIINELKKI